MTTRRAAPKAVYDPATMTAHFEFAGGIDQKLIECLEAFDAWRVEELWDYDYNSAKAAWIGAWFARDYKRD